MSKVFTEMQKNKYEVDYRDVMKGKKYESSIADRLRWLAFAVIDPSCPLKPISSVTTVMKLIYIDKSARDTVSREMYKMSHRLGLLKPNAKGMIKLEPRIPVPNEYETILAFRKQLELSALFHLHHCDDEDHRDTTIRLLHAENNQIPCVKATCDSYSNLEEMVSTKPDIGFLAEVFWKHDTKFHALPSERMDKPEPKPENEVASKTSEEEEQPVQVSMLRMLLERTRLSGSNRFKILQRLQKSFEQHTAIIEAVEAKAVKPPSGITCEYEAGREFSTSEKKIVAAVEKHFVSFKKHFAS